MLTTPRLCIMMFIQFFIWGAWYVTGPNYLETIGFGAEDFGWTYSVGPIAGMISPFLVGMIADRFLPSQVVLGILHLIGTAGMYVATTFMTVENPSPDTINIVFFCFMLSFFPTVAIVNTVAMSNIADTEKTFPMIRVFGTIGWIVAGLTVSWLGADATIDQFYLAIGASALMGLYSFTLPNTPPPAKGTPFSAKQAIGLDAMSLLKDRSFFVFMIGSFLICIPLAFYYQMAARFITDAGMENPAARMTLGQMSEVLFMLALPIFLKKFGIKTTLLVGMIAWVARYAMFSFGADDGVVWMMIGGILLHGICYDFFFVTGQIYTDKIAPPEIRSQAQGMLVFFTLGLGMFIGALVAGKIEAAHTVMVEATEPGAEPGKMVEWASLWLKPAGMAAVVMLLFAFAFSGKKADESTADAA
ncbi:MAG: MFS transporter [Phycisphaeraceae bacterium]|jgi:nucleoside transporter|nr:MAG: MFS transporter [Phycisphaeraceae bacterium]